jgi:hypothetical protein
VSLEQVCSSDVYGPGQYDRRDKNRNAFYHPQARSLCKVKLTFGGKKILAVEPGPAFDPAEWKHIRGDVETALLSEAPKVGREYSFCTFRATGWGRGLVPAFRSFNRLRMRHAPVSREAIIHSSLNSR